MGSDPPSIAFLEEFIETRISRILNEHRGAWEWDEFGPCLGNNTESTTALGCSNCGASDHDSEQCQLPSKSECKKVTSATGFAARTKRGDILRKMVRK